MLNPGRQLSNTQPHAQFLAVGWQKDLEVQKQKHLCQGKNGLINEAKPSVQAKKYKDFSYHFPWAGKCSAVSRKAGLHHM